MRPDLFLATIGRGSNGSNALEVTEDRAAVTAESQDNIINRVNNISQYGPSWHYVPGIGVAGTAYAEVPGSALGDLAFTRASSKTRTNAAGVVETIGNNVPPHDYRNADGTLSTFPRLNLEPQRTNSIRNSSMVGAVAGTPGTVPTNWNIQSGTPTAGLTQTVAGIGAENGLPYIDFRYNGTATSASLEIRLDATTQIAALTGQAWSFSTYCKVVSGTVQSISQAMYERTSAGTIVIQGFQPFVPSSTLQRFTYNRTLSGGGTVAFVQNAFVLGFTIGQTYDFTIRIAAPQMELGAYATTWVPTTTAAVTRLADVASKTGVSSLIGQTEGTLFVDFEGGINDAVDYIYGINDGTTANRIIIWKSTSNTIAAQVRFGGAPQTFIQTSVVLNNAKFKCAIAYKLNDVAFYVNGAQIGTDNLASIPTCNVIALNGGVGTGPLLRPLNEAALFPTRLTNATLAQLTTL